MARKRKLKLWYDREGDYLEVLFNGEAGTFEETDHEQVMVRLNQRNEVIGFSIMDVSKLGGVVDMTLQSAVEHVE